MENQQITYNDIPDVLSYLLAKLEIIGEDVQRLLNRGDQKDSESKWLSVEELCAYLPSHPRKQTVYSWTSTHQIPFHKKGRSIMFDKGEIDEWLQDGVHVKTIDDINQEALAFVNSKRQHHIKY